MSPERRADGLPGDGRELRYLALGDSYTIGESVAPGLRWPQQLVERLRGDGVAIADPQIVAVTGWTTDELSAGMDAATLVPPYDLVSLSIGVNNQYRGRDMQNYRREFAALLQRAIALAGRRAQRVFVVSIPDWGVTRFGRESGRDVAAIARELDAFNAINREEAQRERVAWADVAATSRAAGADAAELADDGLHPSGRQYTAWLATIIPAARAALSSP
ncbi:SGNH/GDSL hydrolase family protein [Tahibacter caeni]|uniref:SGNH/GDSL hydrolase family protein n=1 Tax=Tahibacter caeni TaxID=1453545 RepID=UPI0021481ACA|nr:GDSL-type esterase/lipase family protein [Tahibacter caeni]